MYGLTESSLKGCVTFSFTDVDYRRYFLESVGALVPRDTASFCNECDSVFSCSLSPEAA